MTDTTAELARQVAKTMRENFAFAGAAMVENLADQVERLTAERDAPPVNCMTCVDYSRCGWITEYRERCTNGDKYKPLPAVKLYRTTP